MAIQELSRYIPDFKRDDLSSLDAQYLLVMILSIIRAARFNEGVLNGFLEKDCITKWLIELEKKEQHRS